MKQRILSSVLALCMMLVLLPGTALAAQGGPIKGSNLSWSLSDNGTLSITGSGEMPNYGRWSDERPPWYASRANVTGVSVASGVTYIGTYAFSNCENLKNVSIAASLTSIGGCAFENCQKIAQVNYAGTAAQWCAVSIPGTPNWYALFNADARYTFKDLASKDLAQAGACSAGVKWTLDKDGLLTITGSGAMPNYDRWSDERPPWYASRANITGVSIASGITYIGTYAFSNCGNLQNVSIATSLTSIGGCAFENCQKIAQVNYAGTAAQWCAVSIPGTPNWYALFNANARYTFKDLASKDLIQAGACNADVKWTLDRGGLMTITGSGPMPNYGRWSDERPPWYASRANITGVSIASGITYIGTYAFSDCGNLSNLAFPVSVTAIGNQAFGNCGKIRLVHYAGEQTLWNSISIHNSNDKFLFNSNPTTDYKWNAGAVKRYTITLDANGGTCDELPKIVINGDLYGTLPIPTWPGHIFNGWYTSRTGGTPVTNNTVFNLSKNQTIYARWSVDPSAAVTMKVTFNVNGGDALATADKTKTVTRYDVYGKLPTPTRSGHTFKGWYTASSGGTKVTASTTVNKSGNHTLYAQWTPKSGSIQVKFDYSGATGSSTNTKTTNVVKGGTYGKLPAPTRSGYKFAGWYTASAGGTKVTSTTKVTKTSAHTLYARWARKTYQVFFNANGGTVLREFNAVVNGAPYGNMPTPTYPGRHFKGWYTAKSGGSKVTPSTKVVLTGNKTLYAQWSTAAVTATAPKSVSKRLTIPAYYELALYGSTTSAKPSGYEMFMRDTVITCTRTSTLSNGTVRYYAKIGSGSYWFTFTDEMLNP